MDNITVKLPVTIKAKLTEKLKKRIIEELTNSITQTDLQLQQLDIEEKRVVETQAQNDLQRLQAIRQHFGIERQKGQSFKAEAEQKLADTKKLAIGAEIVQGTLERLAILKVGDDMREMMNVEVLVEDDKIIAIRS
ncbi:MAG: YlqD family protein [Schwartzia sp.]|nr:YlqD family protein [Schwartzia sp. (in: firmicutes)]